MAARMLVAAVLLGISASAAADRLVIAGGAITEIIHALGAEDQIVGVDSTSTWPPEAREHPRVGYVRDLPVEGILALNPDRMLVTPEAGPERALARLSDRIPVSRIDASRSPRGVLQRVQTIADIVDRRLEGEALARELEDAFEAVSRQLPLESPPRVLFLLATEGHGAMVAGRETQAQALLDAVELPNAAADMEGFKPLNVEAAMALEPELIVVAETAPGGFDLGDWPGLRQTPAGRDGRVLVRDSMYLLGFGPRLPEAMAELADAAADRGSVEWSRR